MSQVFLGSDVSGNVLSILKNLVLKRRDKECLNSEEFR